jgi:signal transduction histidine kinase
MESARTPLTRLAWPWLGAAIGLALAIGCGLLLAELLMSPPEGELRDMAAYFALAGVATLAGAWLALRATDRVLGLSIQAKSFLGGLLAGGIALINVLIIAQLMFISTDHDLKLLTAVALFSTLVSAVFSVGVARSLATRISATTTAVRALAEGDLEARAEVSGGDEAGRLAQDINTLGERLREAQEQRDALDRERIELTAAISHDLRTPLASLRAMAEALDDGLISGDEGKRYYTMMRREIERLNRMIDDLMELARLDAGGLQLNRERLSVTEIAADVVDALQPQARLREVSVSLEASEEKPIPVDASRIERAIGNLLRNAISHTPAGGSVRVSVSQDNGWTDVSVSDSGEGIEAGELQRVWERFYRAEKSRVRRSENDDGAGLGLAIVRGIVEAHGGTVAARSEPGAGSTFTIRLPAG